jgi:hypothetical protein
MYPNKGVQLKREILIDEFPIAGTNLEVGGRVVFPSDGYANIVKQKIHCKLEKKMPEIRFYWNNENLNIYPESNFNPDISTKGVTLKVNKFIRMIQYTADIIKEAGL